MEFSDSEMEVRTSKRKPGAGPMKSVPAKKQATEEIPSTSKLTTKSLAMNQDVTDPKHRARAYPPSWEGAPVVFIMPRTKPLDLRSIAGSLHQRYPGLVEIFRVRPNKIKVTAKDRAQANVIAADPIYTEHYRVYIPGSSVEVTGVVEELDLPEEDIVKFGQGAFNHPNLPKVKVLEVKKLYRATS